MITRSALEEPFCKRVSFSHSKNTIVPNPETQTFYQKYRQSFRLRRCQSMKKTRQAENHYDHYYVDPELRFKVREGDPKLQKQSLTNPNYLYDKLHDEHFNHWQHPFERTQSKTQSLIGRLSKQDVKNLNRLKQKIESGQGRVPMIVSKYIERGVDQSKL